MTTQNPLLGGSAHTKFPAKNKWDRSLYLAIFFASGFAALAYQVVWARQLSLLFGSTAQAFALVIAIFFAGIALGSWYWGSRVHANPLATFGRLEIGVGIVALAYFGLGGAFSSLYPMLYSLSAGSVDIPARILIATVVLLPASFLMGGTLPAMTEVLAETEQTLVRSGTVLYAVNTLGGASGALAAGIFLPPLIGFNLTYLIAIGVDLSVGITALLRSRTHTNISKTPLPSSTPPRQRPPATVLIIAALSGATTLGLEIVWTRLFSQVLQNSAYTYAIVLSTFLIALALGAAVARILATRLQAARGTLVALLALSAVAAASSPWIFRWATGDLQSIGQTRGFWSYLISTLGVAIVVMLIPGAIVGSVLPYLLRLGHYETFGKSIGRLVMVNTIGAIVGSLMAGFVLLPLFGTTRSALMVGATYFGMIVLLLAPRRPALASIPALAALALLLVPLGSTNTARLFHSSETLIDIREGPDATVTVVGQGSHRSIRVNNSYTLGGTRSAPAEQTQAALPLLLHGQPRSAFALGMGTGITAGASLNFPIERLLVCELIGDVIDLARDNFEPWTNGLFTDPRVEIKADDGRVCLSRSDETFDVIMSDLFTPWHAGTGNLYTLEHFITVRDRLNPGGVFAQWIPLYQVSDAELFSLIRTMQESFDQVTIWRGDFFPERSIAAIVGHKDAGVEGQIDRNLNVPDDQTQAALLLQMYVGNASAPSVSSIWQAAPVNRDAHPFIEYSAPKTQRAVRAGTATFVTGAGREGFYDQLARFDEDPLFARLSPDERGYVLAGRAKSQALWLAHIGQDEASQEAFERHKSLVPPGISGDTSFSRALFRDFT